MWEPYGDTKIMLALRQDLKKQENSRNKSIKCAEHWFLTTVKKIYTGERIIFSTNTKNGYLHSEN